MGEGKLKLFDLRRWTKYFFFLSTTTDMPVEHCRQKKIEHDRRLTSVTVCELDVNRYRYAQSDKSLDFSG